MAYIFYGINLVPVHAPIELKANEHFRSAFTTQIGGWHEVRVVTELRMNRLTQRCLLGFKERLEIDACNGVPPELDITWKVLTHGVLIASGRSLNGETGYFEPSAMIKTIGLFEAERGADYTLEVLVNRTSAQLQRTNPYLEVTIGSMGVKELNVGGTIAMVAAVLVSVLGLILLLISKGLRDACQLQPA